MSVQKMHSRRMKSRAQPPGIKVLSDYDWNNSAEKRKRTGILSLSNVAKILKNFVLSKVILDFDISHLQQDDIMMFLMK